MSTSAQISVIDLGVHLETQDQGPIELLLRSDTARWELIHLGEDERWIGNASTERTLLVLEGIATLEAKQWRQSLGSGHLITLPATLSFELVCDAPTPFRGLLCTHAIGQHTPPSYSETPS